MFYFRRIFTQIFGYRWIEIYPGRSFDVGFGMLFSLGIKQKTGFNQTEKMEA